MTTPAVSEPEVLIEGLDALDQGLDESETVASALEDDSLPSPSSAQAEAPAAVAPPAAAGAEAEPAPAAPPAPDPRDAELAQLKAQVAQAQREETYRRQQAQEQAALAQWSQQVDAEAAVLKQRLEAQGVPDTDIAGFVNERKALRQAQFQQAQSAYMAQREQEARHQVADMFVEKYQLTVADRKELLKHPTPQAMELQAQVLRGQRQQAAEKKQAAPPTRYDTGVRPAAAPASDEQLLRRYDAGEINSDYPGVRQALRNGGYR